MNTLETRFDAMTVLSDLFDDEVFAGWAIPRGRMDAFLEAVQEAALDAGAVPFTSIDFLDFDSSVTSLLGIGFKKESKEVVSQAEGILRGA